MLQKQFEAAEEVRAHPEKAIIFGLEHPNVITLGVRGSVIEDLQMPQDLLSLEGYDIVPVRRGGQATLHNPGQLVIYPILPLRHWHIGVRDYVCMLQRATVQYLARYGVRAWAGTEEPGVYTDRGKIAYFGLQVSQGVALHGLSINVSNQLSDFQFIRSCGKEKESFDSLINYNSHLSLMQEFQLWCHNFSEQFEEKTHPHFCEKVYPSAFDPISDGLEDSQ